MKKTFVRCLLPLSLVAAGSSLADSGPGCGLGQNIFSGQSGLAAHVLAATTNGSSSNQLFGLSFDSLGCDGESVITAQFQRSVYVAANYDNLARDAAKGGGHHLESLATLMQMDSADADRFYALAQNKYDLLFSASEVDHDHWLQQLDLALAAEPGLSKYVSTTKES